MNRSQAHQYMWKAHTENPYVIRWDHHVTIRTHITDLINAIYNDHENQLKLLEKENELNALRAFRDGVKTQQKIDYGYNLLRKTTAMLFWQWRYFKNSEYQNTFVEARAKVLFFKVYNLLKGN